MSATFRRRVTGPSDEKRFSILGLKGTKPWTGGITLTSTGLRDLDNILGGGLPLGTSIYIQEEHWAQGLGLALVKYWCSEVSSNETRRCVHEQV
jgi:hypothetical protein